MHVLEIVSLMLREQVGFYNAGFTLNTRGGICWGIFLNFLNYFCTTILLYNPLILVKNIIYVILITGEKIVICCRYFHSLMKSCTLRIDFEYVN